MMVAKELNRELQAFTDLVGVCCLAAGADQIFATAVLSQGGRLHVVIPCSDYEASFAHAEELKSFSNLLAGAEERQQLDFNAPSEAAFMAAGQVVVEQSDSLIAVWDGARAAGFGGTGDVVRYAEQLGKPVIRVWPAGSSR